MKTLTLTLAATALAATASIASAAPGISQKDVNETYSYFPNNVAASTPDAHEKIDMRFVSARDYNANPAMYQLHNSKNGHEDVTITWPNQNPN